MVPPVPTPLQLVGRLGVLALDHTALAVRDLDAARAFFGDLLGGAPTGYQEVPAQGFRWLGLHYPNGGSVELLAAMGERGFLHDFLAHRGEGPHHLTFMVADLRQAVGRARAAGLRVVDEQYADPAWQEAFISPHSAFGTIVQLAQSVLSAEERRGRWPVPGHPRGLDPAGGT